jgi:HSP20 family protein
MDLIKWEPLRETLNLSRAMDRLFDNALMRSPLMSSEYGTSLVPPIDMYETENAVIVKAVMPGVSAENLNIDVAGDTLTIKGETKSETEDKKDNYFYRECRYGTFTRSLTLPAGVKSDKTEADIEDGVLTLTIPKSESVKPKAIKVTAKKTENKVNDTRK